MTATDAPAPDFWTVDGGTLTVHPHRGQSRALRSDKRFVAVLAGTQGGKTVVGPYWLFREMQRRGPGDYLAVSPTYPLLKRKALPEFKRLFEDTLGLGRYYYSDKVFTVSEAGERRLFGAEQDTPTHVYFGYAENPDSLESATAKAAWLDEAGQKSFKLQSWEAIQRRLAIHEGRALITTTLYNLGWVVQKLWRPWQEAGGEHPEIEVVRFESVDNPTFPESEWQRLKREWPAWKFNLQCRAIPTRPAGLIYDAFDPDRDTVPRFAIKEGWPRYVGVDFGGVNTAAVWYARDPDSGTLYVYDTYHEGGKTSQDHAESILEGHPFPELAAGGAKSEGQWRREFRASGLPLKEPRVDDVEVGIDRVYGFHARGELKVVDDLDEYLTEKETYSRALDDDGQPTEKIDDKHSFHLMDAERYILSHLAPSAGRDRVTEILQWG